MMNGNDNMEQYPSMGEEMNNMNTPQNEIEDNEFGNNFDAGIQADEENDPKTYIQQLTGKLSETLRKYNEDLPVPDSDLSKYVAGMIVKQCVKGLSPEDTKDIYNKLTKGNKDKSNDSNNTNNDMDLDSEDNFPINQEDNNNNKQTEY